MEPAILTLGEVFDLKGDSLLLRDLLLSLLYLRLWFLTEKRSLEKPGRTGGKGVFPVPRLELSFILNQPAFFFVFPVHQEFSHSGLLR